MLFPGLSFSPPLKEFYTKCCSAFWFGKVGKSFRRMTGVETGFLCSL